MSTAATPRGEFCATDAARSLFLLRQVLQRGSCREVGEALAAVAAGVGAREPGACAVADAWLSSSPLLEEVFRCGCSLSGTADGRTLGCLRVLAALLPRTRAR
eukprot:CAMPEP_0119276028 /NCGR_PEP_ID=MMETSP1329-20130426/14730_1 /TAXON_ID=114041 /ORGANISM="Genus nov. species nov., Strain RCC1024" /LENGTH=102 /DNA_ID=CAMNT_0007276449 /DNA_START=38 /DNA_END=342 /DNA_ORIENTATION=-